VDIIAKSALDDKLGFLNRICSGRSLLTFQYNLLVELQPLLPWEQVILVDAQPWILPLNDCVPFSIPDQSCPTGIWQWERSEQCDRTAQIQSALQSQYLPERPLPLGQVWCDWCNTIADHYRLPNWVLMMVEISLGEAQINQYQVPILLLRSQGAFNSTEIGTLRIIHDALQQIVDKAIVLEKLLSQSKDDPEIPTIASDAQTENTVASLHWNIDDRPEPCIQKCLQTLGLTPRQVEVMHLIIKGKELVAIAQELGCTESTVRKHVENLYRRLGVQTRTAAIAQVLDTIGIV
jgi:DNA-binding CsgD family transcriptional regulator